MTNTFTNNGRNILLNRLYLDAPTYTAPSKFKVGIESVTPTVNDNDLTRAVPILPSNVMDTCESISGWFPNLTNTNTLNTTSYKTGTGAINLVKNDITSVDCNSLRGITAVDFTAKTYYGFFYLSTSIYAILEPTTAAVEIRIGIDSSNYYQFTRTKAQLSAGWNTISFTSSTAVTVGTPTITACTYLSVGYYTSTITDITIDGDFIYDNLVLANAASYTKIFVSGYPSFNLATNEATIRCYLSSVEAIGYLIDSFGLFNTDIAPLMSETDTFGGESKSQKDEFALIKVVRVL